MQKQKLAKTGNSFLFVNDTKTYQLKAKYSPKKTISIVFKKILKKKKKKKKKKKGLNQYVYDFSVDSKIVDYSNIINICKYLMKKHDIK